MAQVGMIWDEMATFPEDVLKLEHYVGPSIDVGPIIMAEISIKNEKVLHRSTYRLLTPDEILDQEESDVSEQFMVKVDERQRSQVLPRDWRT